MWNYGRTKFGERDIDEEQAVGNEKPGQPTGFAPYNSYNPQINIDSSNAEYILIDKNNFTNFLSIFPCKKCLQETLEVKLNDLKGYAPTLSVAYVVQIWLKLCVPDFRPNVEEGIDKRRIWCKSENCEGFFLSGKWS